MIGTDGIEHEALNGTYQDLCDQQADQIVPEEKIQTNPQQGLSNQVAADTREQNRSHGLFFPK